MSNTSTVISMNNTSGYLIIDGDPNWDDQQLKIDGNVINAPYTYASGQSVGVSVDGWKQGNANMMGIWYVGPNNNNENKDNFQMTIGQNSEGLLAITDVYPLPPMSIKYSVIAQTAWMLVLEFESV